MKKYKIYALLVIIIVIAVTIISSRTSKFSTIVPENLPEDVAVLKTLDNSSSTLVSVAKANNVEMKIDPSTTNVLLYNNGKEVAQTLPGIEENSKNVLLKSPLVVNYKLTNTSAATSINAYEDSIEKGNYQIDLIDNGVQVTYTIGEDVVPLDQVPQAVKKKRYEKIHDSASSSEQATLDAYYSYSKEKDAYIRPPEVKPSKVASIYDIFYTTGGYTSDDLADDNKILSSTSNNVADPINFIVPVQYLLDSDGNFNIKIALDNVQASGVEQLTSIDVLPGMMETKDGYFLVPDGSGAIVDVTNPKVINKYTKEFSPISEDVIGKNEDIVSEGLMLPVFANQNILGIIDSGAASTSLNLDLSSKNKLIYPSINMQYDKFYEINTTGSGVNLSSKASTGEFSTIYQINPKEKSYYEYSQIVSDYYKQKYKLSNIEDKFSINLEILGTYNFTNYMLGVPYSDLAKLTSIDELNKLITELNDNVNYNLSYYGWADSGLKSNILETKLNKVCGKDSQLKNIENLSYAINAVTLDENYLGKFNKHTDVVNGVEGEANKMYPILNSSFLEDEYSSAYYYLSPRKLEDVTDKFIKDFKLGDSITIADLGKLGYADYKRNEEVLPNEAEQIVMSTLEKLSKSYNLTIESPILERGFTSNNITGLPSESSNSDIFDYDIPFTQLVYNGLISNSNEPINLSEDGNVRLNVLKAMETKSNLDYVLSFNDTAALKNSEFDKYYAVKFDYWKDIINKSADEYQKFLNEIDNGNITDFQIIDTNVSKVTYDSGYTAYFNLNSSAVSIDGNTIAAENYLVKGES